MKIAYCGIDVLCGCLKRLHQKAEIVKVFTYSNDSYDETKAICDFASDNNILYTESPISKSDILAMEEEGVEWLVVAGYAKKIPVSDKIKQVNVHPSFLPDGRGAWPMPVSIMKNAATGVTLHKLSEEFDCGDILLQEKIELSADDTLDSLTDKVISLSEKLLDEFFDNPVLFWENATKQQGGSYWKEPSDADRTLRANDTTERASLLSRAFGSYGVLYQNENEGKYILQNPKTSKEFSSGALPLADGWLVGEKKLYFAPFTIKDRRKLEDIRNICHPQLSDYTFSLLYCWRKDMHLSVYYEKDLFCVKGDDYFFAPVGKMQPIKAFLIQLRKEHPQGITFRFCDRTVADCLCAMFLSDAEVRLCPDDSDYVISCDRLCNLPGSDLSSRRNAVRHYSRVEPQPVVEKISTDNIEQVKEFAKTVEQEDAVAQITGLSNFEELKLCGALVRRGGEIVSFCTVVEQDKNTLQGQFLKCKDRERGAELYAMQAGVLSAGGNYQYVNMEDDMGVEGLRRFKQSLGPEVINSYTVHIKGSRD